MALLHGAMPPESLADTHVHLDCCQDCRFVLANLAQTGSVTPAEVVGSVPRGTIVGRYLVLELLGVGAYGRVLLAFDPNLNRRVTLKLLRGEAAADAPVRLNRQAQATAQLSHSNIVGVYDVGEFEGQTFLAMEHAEGGNLRTWLDERPREWRDVLRIFLAAGSGLAAAYHAGLVHRDFKPDNVLLSGSGRAQVSDFGLARGAMTLPLGPMPEELLPLGSPTTSASPRPAWSSGPPPTWRPSNSKATPPTRAATSSPSPFRAMRRSSGRHPSATQIMWTGHTKFAPETYARPRQCGALRH